MMFVIHERNRFSFDGFFLFDFPHQNWC